MVDRITEEVVKYYTYIAYQLVAMHVVDKGNKIFTYFNYVPD